MKGVIFTELVGFMEEIAGVVFAELEVEEVGGAPHVTQPPCLADRINAASAASDLPARVAASASV